jgi:endonuclease/exonuclease/phosphatase (EEP) superfamily protein YafD
LSEVGDRGGAGGGAGDGGGAGRGGRGGRRLCLAILAAALAGLGLGRLAGLWIAFDLFNHFLWHLAILAVAAVIACLLPRWRTRAAIALALAGFFGISLGALTFGRDAGTLTPPAPGERALKVMSFNTWLSNDDWRAVAAEVTRQDADVVVLVEFGSEKAPLLDALAAAYPYRVDCLKISYCHLAVISKYPFSKSEARTRWRGPPFIRVRFGAELGNLTVFGVHTIRPPYFRSQLKQFGSMARIIAATPGPRLAAGDFNATPPSVMLDTFVQGSGLERLTWLPTWPARFGPFPQIAIDHMFVSSEIRVLSRPVLGDNAGSDHYPVIATIAVKTGPGR